MNADERRVMAAGKADEDRDSYRDSAEYAIFSNAPGLREAMATGTAKTNPPTGGSTMAQTATAQPASEVTGVASLVSYLQSVADRHAQIGSGEAFLGSLNRMEVGADDQQLVATAQEASRNAADMWSKAAADVAAHNLPLREQYSLNPSAGNKDANTNE